MSIAKQFHGNAWHRTALSALVLGGTLLSPMMASAGFQWVSPAVPAPVVPVVPVAPVAQAPVVVTPEPMAPAAAYAPAPMPLSAAPVAMAPIPAQVTQFGDGPLVVQAPASAPIVVGGPAAKAPGVVEGFGDRVPVSVALRQILPAGYAFSIAPTADPATPITWRGGRPWMDVLQDALAPAGLIARIDSNATSPNVVVDRPIAAANVVPPVAAAPTSLAPMSSASVSLAPMAVAAPVQMVAAEPAVVQKIPAVETPMNWGVTRGDTLRKTLDLWCQQANVELSWQADYDYPVKASAGFTGTFEDAVSKLISGFEDAQPVPYGRFYRDPGSGHAVLVVQTRGNHYGS
ncbi:MAG: TcpQ domain-containing protein [Alphaproteobacteria bacterium]|nr:MAG: TcpQ domain-containing protein [Alphaproteobacteria bacterium]